MLILTRRMGEAVNIGKDVVVTIMAINGNQVRLGIAAPKDVIVLREELVGKRVKHDEPHG